MARHRPDPMFRRSRELSFSRYESRRSRWRPPAWLLLSLFGAAVGVAGVLLVQQRYLPPRLSIDESSALRAAHAQADAERLRLQRELDQSQSALGAAVDDRTRLGSELAASRAAVTQLQTDLRTVVDALPPDPRNGVVAVRSARFVASGGQLAFNLVLTRQRAGQRPMVGQIRLLVAGENAERHAGSVVLKPIALSMGSHEVVSGSLPLPVGFTPRQTTVEVVDRPAGKVLGMRVLTVE